MKRLMLLALMFCCSFARADEPPVPPSHLDDVRTWREVGLPVFAEWNAGGYNFTWHVDHLRVGYRIVPAIRLPPTDVLEIQKQSDNLEPFAPDLAYVAGTNPEGIAVPLSLRDGNQISTRMSLIRGPTDLADWRNMCATCVRVKPDGTLDATPITDPLAPTLLYRNEGDRIGRSLWMANLQRLCPTPSAIEYDDNNEGPKGEAKTFLRFTPASPGDPTKVPPLPPTPEAWAWKSEAELGGISIRMLEYGQGAQWLHPDAVANEAIPLLLETQWNEYFNGMQGAFTGWAGKAIFSNAYSANRDWNTYDTFGPAIYPGSWSTSDLTDPFHLAEIKQWEPLWITQRQRRDKRFAREVFLSMSGKRALAPAVAGQHKIVDPQIWQAFCELMLWAAHDRQPAVSSPVGVKLHEWQLNATKPTDLFFSEDDHPTLAAFGRSDLEAATHGDYSLCAAKAVNRVCEDSTLRDFWLHGTEATIGGTTAGVQAQALKRGGNYLIYLFDPRELTDDPVHVTLDGIDRALQPLTKPGEYSLLAPPENVDLIETRLP